MKEFRDASGRLSIDLAGYGQEFRMYASRLENRCGGKLVQQLSGLDQSYWDYDVGGTTVVLSWDTFAGISVYTEDGSQDELLKRIAAMITEPDAPPTVGPTASTDYSNTPGGPRSVS